MGGDVPLSLTYRARLLMKWPCITFVFVHLTSHCIMSIEGLREFVKCTRFINGVHLFFLSQKWYKVSWPWAVITNKNKSLVGCSHNLSNPYFSNKWISPPKSLIPYYLSCLGLDFQPSTGPLQSCHVSLQSSKGPAVFGPASCPDHQDK